MKEQFDKKLIEKIKISFENHEEPFSPQEWEKLSHAYFHPAKKKKFAFWPFLISGIAASLLLVFVFWPFEDELQQNVQSIADSITIEGKQFEKIELPKDKVRENLALAEKELAPVPTEVPKAVAKTEEPQPIQRDAVEPILVNGLPQASTAWAPVTSPEKTNIVEELHQNAANERIGAPVIAYDSEAEQAQRYLDQWKTEGGSTEPQKESGNRNIRLGLLVGPQAASNQVSGMSLGAGVMSEFSISKRLKLDVGVTYASHSMAPDISQPLAMTMDSPSPQKEAFASLSSSPRLIGSNAELNFSGLDIPVNLKYKVVDKEKSGLFLITGLSSMVYFDQQTTETMAVNSYFNANTDGQLEFQRTVQQYTHEAGPTSTADGFDLGRMLNLSVGYEYNLKNGTYLSIEPYYKLPLGDMTFANQQFSIGGLNLRMNFRLGK